MVDSKVGLSEGESELQRRLEAEREQLLASVETSVTMKKLQSQLELHQLLYSRREKRLEKLLKAQAAEHLVGIQRSVFRLFSRLILCTVVILEEAT